MKNLKIIKSIEQNLLGYFSEEELLQLPIIIKKMGLKSLRSLINKMCNVKLSSNDSDIIQKSFNSPLIKKILSLEPGVISKEEALLILKLMNILTVLGYNFFPDKFSDIKLEMTDKIIDKVVDLDLIYDSPITKKRLDFFKNKREILISKNNSIHKNHTRIGVSLLIFDGTQNQLNKFNNFLVAQKILEPDSDFSSHFIIKGKPNPLSFKLKKIKWFGTMNELTDLFVCLVCLDFLPETYFKTPFKHIIQHFCKSDGTEFNNKYLSNSYKSKGLLISVDNFKFEKPYPKSVERIRKIFHKVLG